MAERDATDATPMRSSDPRKFALPPSGGTGLENRGRTQSKKGR